MIQRNYISKIRERILHEGKNEFEKAEALNIAHNSGFTSFMVYPVYQLPFSTAQLVH